MTEANKLALDAQNEVQAQLFKAIKENKRLRGTLEYIATQSKLNYSGVLTCIRMNAEAALNDDWQKTHTKAITALEAAQAPDLNKCPSCGGPADNGIDRCVPPTPYNCTKCEQAPVDDDARRDALVEIDAVEAKWLSMPYKVVLSTDALKTIRRALQAPPLPGVDGLEFALFALSQTDMGLFNAAWEHCVEMYVADPHEICEEAARILHEYQERQKMDQS